MLDDDVTDSKPAHVVDFFVDELGVAEPCLERNEPSWTVALRIICRNTEAVHFQDDLIRM